MKQQKNKTDDVLDREIPIFKWLVDQAKTIIELRNKEGEFHGLHREFMYFYSEMLLQWEKSKHVKHPRDVGVIRENILGKFFQDNALLPKKYSLSQTSVRVCSTEGFISREIDILFYMSDENIRLMGRDGGYEVYPVEAAAGAIEVKSRLNTGELEDAFKNIASIRRLRKAGSSHQPFGIIFAYDSDLTWTELVENIRLQSAAYQRDELPNAIFVLTKGHFAFGDDEKSSIDTTALSNDRTKITVYGNPSRDHLLLFRLYSFVLHLLRKAPTLDVPIDSYGVLPLTVGSFSYQFNLGNFAELASCKFHGPIALRFSESSLKKIVDYCRNSPPTSFASAMAAAYPGNGAMTTGNQWRTTMVHIYNPNSLPYDQILAEDKPISVNGAKAISRALAFHMISCEGMEILIPFHYDKSEALFERCAECIKLERKIATAKTPIRYLGPRGETWTGRGKKPAWAVEAIANGKKISDFEIKSDE